MHSRSDLYQNFMNNNESTMKRELVESVALVLLKLAHRFSENPAAKLAESKISELQVNSYIEALSEKVAGQDEEIKNAWLAIKNRFNEPINELDSISTWIEGEQISYVIDLKTSLALVYAALTDQDAYWQEAIARLPVNTSDKDRITLRGCFEEQYSKDEDDRLLTLWRCFKTIQSKGAICHTGVRNEFCMTLNGVYPGVHFIEDMKAFVHELLSNHLHTQIKSFESNPKLHRDIILAKMGDEHLEPLKEALKKSKPNLLESIKKACAAHGLNSDHFSVIIQENIKRIEDLSLSWGKDEALSSLATLFAPRFKEDELLKKVKSWISENYELQNTGHKQRVISFARVEKASDLYNKYQAMLRTWNQELITAAQIERLHELLNAYKEGCEKECSPQIADETLIQAMEAFEKAAMAFKEDARCDWVENFFSRWLAYRGHGPAARKQLFRELTNPEMQKKYEVNSDFLEQLFLQKTEEIEITPYQINRIFLHAIVVHPQKWTGLFFKCFSEVYTYVAIELAKETLDHRARTLKKDSYPPELMAQLEYLQAYYQHFQGNQDEPDRIDYYVPMRHLILTNSQLLHVIHYFPGIFQETVLLKSLIKDCHDLCFVVNRLPNHEELSPLLNALGDEFLKSLIKSHEELGNVVSSVEGSQREFFTNSLSSEFLKSLIKNLNDLISLLRQLSDAKCEAFIGFLDSEYLIPLIKDYRGLCILVKKFETKKINALLKALGEEGLKSLIKNYKEFEEVVDPLFKLGRELLTDSLSAEFLKSLIKNLTDLLALRRLLSVAKREAFMASFDTEFLTPLIKDRDNLCTLVNELDSAGEISALLNALGDEGLKSLIKNHKEFKDLVDSLFKFKRELFSDSLSPEFLTSLIRNLNDLSDVRGELPLARKETFMAALDYEFLKSLIKNIADLSTLRRLLPQAHREAFIGSLNADLLMPLIEDEKGLCTVLNELETSGEISALLNALGDEGLKSLIKSYKEFKEVRCSLGIVKGELFTSFLSSEFLKSLIKNLKDLIKLRGQLSAEKREAFIGSMDTKLLISLIMNRDDLCTLVNELDTAGELSALLKALGDEGLKSLIKSYEELNEMSGSLFIHLPNFLPSEFLMPLIKNLTDLLALRKELSSAKKVAFMASLDTEFLTSLIKDRNDLRFVVGNLATHEEISALLKALGDEALKSLIKSHEELNEVVFATDRGEYFKQSLSLDFLKSLDKDGSKVNDSLPSMPQKQTGNTEVNNLIKMSAIFKSPDYEPQEKTEPARLEKGGATLSL